MRILCIGECMAELAPTDREGDYRLGFAGDTFNTAWYLARAGIAVSFLSAVGDDDISARMRGAMREGGIDDGPVATVPGSTVGLYLISLADGERSFTYWRGQSAARHLAADPARLRRAFEGCDLIYLSGITLAILDPAACATLLDALDEARAAGRTVAFDPNLRPRLWPDADRMRDAVTAAAGRADIALPSHEDEASWFGDADPGATAARYAAAGATTVVVKDGAAPVIWRHEGQTGGVPVAPVPRVVDTTAAGDSFNAGLLAGLAEGAALPDAIARGCRIAGQVVQGRGALVPVDTA